eukprot:CAMPEP_0202701508 /NCGR_PEP_ID=MMETSP1385-20130828/14593_1 /ASSEMBLY_ACC=CAM_ASM_000861 /TAXON_ID=933848 /ORGANISM="Elphidium margaritaceum" /LENGTH=381 /DNA_ID=CAMNT_0049358945 /DNA_START=35 /DNA_END=1180 /DNA_ORIENTATION=-
MAYRALLPLLIAIGLILPMTVGYEIGSGKSGKVKPYREIKSYVDEAEFSKIFESLYRPYDAYQPVDLYIFLNKKSIALFLKLNDEKKLRKAKAKALQKVKPKKKKVEILLAKELGHNALSSDATSTSSGGSTELSPPFAEDDQILSKLWIDLGKRDYAAKFDDFFKNYKAYFLYRHLRTKNAHFGGILLTNAEKSHCIHVGLGSMGTITGPDWTADFDFDVLKGSKAAITHRGFDRIAEENLEQMLKLIGKDEIGTTYKHFTFTGHSLGASTALLLSTKFQKQYGDLLQQGAVEAITFGPPKSFTKEFVKQAAFIAMVKKMNIINVLDKNDFVRKLPVGYLNVGKTVLFKQCRIGICHNVKNVYEKWVEKFFKKEAPRIKQ